MLHYASLLNKDDTQCDIDYYVRLVVFFRQECEIGRHFIQFAQRSHCAIWLDTCAY